MVCPHVVARKRGQRAPSASPDSQWEAPDTSMTRSADDETLRVPAGCPKHPVHRPCLRRAPGRDSTLERRRPEVGRRRGSIELPLVHLMASARPVPSGLRFPGTTLTRAEQLRCHATTTPCRFARALPNAPRFVISPSANPRTGARWLRLAAACAFPIGTEATWLPRRHPHPWERRVVRDRICLLASPASTTLLHGSILAESASPSARYEASSLLRAARRG